MVDDRKQEPYHTKTWKQRHFSGWRFGVKVFSLAGATVLVANIAIAVFAVRQYGRISLGFKPVFTGDCKHTTTLNTWVHFTINILSSILLAGSNFTMQVLSAPTREEVSWYKSDEKERANSAAVDR
jgi:hypothetical protein